MERAIIPAWPEQPVILEINRYAWPKNDYRPRATAMLCYDAKQLTVLLRASEANPLTRYTKNQDPVYTDSCLEFFLQPWPDLTPAYLNFEFNSAGTLLCAIGKNRHERRRLTDTEISGLTIEASRGADLEPYWQIRLIVSLEWLRDIGATLGIARTDLVFASGRVLRANFYKCGDETPQEHYGSWSPVTSENPDFHRPEDFGTLILG